MQKTKHLSDDFELQLPSRRSSDSPKQIQFPLSVFFELTGIVAVVFMFANGIGFMAAVGLSLMAISILLRQGVAAMSCFAFALATATTGAYWGATVLCVVLGGLIACWPIARAEVLSAIR